MLLTKQICAVLLSGAMTVGMVCGVSAAAEKKMYTVELKDSETIETATGSEYYPTRTKIVNAEYDGVITQVFFEDENAAVKMGDRLFEITRSVDEEALKAAKLEAETARETYQTNLAAKEEKVKTQKTAKNAASGTERKKLEIKVQMAELELEEFIYKQLGSVEAKEAAVAEMEALREPIIITAPEDGNLADMKYTAVGKEVKAGATLGYVQDISRRMVKVAKAFAAGQVVSLTIKTRTEERVFEGRVVASSSMVSGAKAFSVIEIDNEKIGTEKISLITVNGVTKSLKNLITVPYEVVTSINNNYYVTVVDEDGKLTRRRVIVGDTLMDSIWVLEGLNVGDILVYY